MTILSDAYDLSQLTISNLTTSSMDSEEMSFRLSLETEEGAIRFGFQSEQHRDDIMVQLRQFVVYDLEEKEVDEDNETSLGFIYLDPERRAILEFTDSSKTALKREIPFNKVSDDGVKVEGDRVILKMNNDEDPVEFVIKDKEARAAIVTEIEEALEYRKNMDKLMKENYPNLKLFENIESVDLLCDGIVEGCQSLDRVLAALKYYEFLVISRMTRIHVQDPKGMFGEFCDKYYPKHVFLGDYIHWVCDHKSMADTIAIRKRLHFICESAKLCGATTRHYRDRGQDNAERDETTPRWYADQMDCIHFNIRHLEQVGLRMQSGSAMNDTEVDDEKEDESSKSESSFTTKRLDGSTNLKFTLQVDDGNSNTFGDAEQRM